MDKLFKFFNDIKVNDAPKNERDAQCTAVQPAGQQIANSGTTSRVERQRTLEEKRGNRNSETSRREATNTSTNTTTDTAASTSRVKFYDYEQTRTKRERQQEYESAPIETSRQETERNVEFNSIWRHSYRRKHDGVQTRDQVASNGKSRSGEQRLEGRSHQRSERTDDRRERVWQTTRPE